MRVHGKGTIAPPRTTPIRRRVRAAGAADGGRDDAGTSRMNTPTTPDDQTFHKLLLLGVRPITNDRAMLERLGFAPHFEEPKSEFHAKIWSRCVEIRGREIRQYAFLEPQRRVA